MPARTPMSPRDALRALPTAYHRAIDRGMNVHAYLEWEDPSNRYGSDSDERRLDAFGRIMREGRIISRSNPAAGLYATELTALLNGTHIGPNDEPIGRDVGRALAMIWIERRWRAAKYQRSPSTRAMFTSEDDALGSIIRPWEESGVLRAEDLTPDLPLTALIAQETAITGSGYRTSYLSDPEDGELEFVRVTEATEIPTAKIRTREQNVRLHKRGRAIDWSYEAARQMTLDKFELFIARMALAVEAGKINDLIDVAINGDGNADTGAEVINVADLDSVATGDGITLRAYLALRKRFKGGYRMNALLARSSEIIDLEMLEIGPLNMPFVSLPATTGIGSISPFAAQTATGVRYGDVDTAVPAQQYLAMDTRFAIERISEIGATVSEADNFITSQVNVLTFTESEGFASMFPNAVKLLDVNRS